MEKQEQKGSRDLKHIYYPFDEKHADVKTSSVSNQMKEIEPSGEEQTHRVRKPYIITKQRERWTEEEHQKFLEAVQLYGRAWRRIEEHIGSKTTVQIRSHAQKFFSKVVSKTGTTDKTEIIDIPPPRPKRKPVQPYPRTLGNMFNKGTLKQLEKPPRLSAICEQENGSPTSVLSAIGAETPGCSYPSASSSNHQDDRDHSPNVKVEEEHKLPYNCSAAPASTMQDQHQMDMDVCSGVHTSSESQATTLKLFGKMIVVADANKAFASSAGNTANPKLASPPQRVDHQDKNVDHLLFKPGMSLRSHAEAGNACLGLIPSPIFYCFPFTRDSFVEPSVLPWRPMYYNFPLPFIYSQTQCHLQNPTELIQREGSRTGSNTAPTSCVADDTDGVYSSKEVNLEENGLVHC